MLCLHSSPTLLHRSNSKVDVRGVDGKDSASIYRRRRCAVGDSEVVAGWCLIVVVVSMQVGRRQTCLVWGRPLKGLHRGLLGTVRSGLVLLLFATLSCDRRKSSLIRAML